MVQIKNIGEKKKTFLSCVIFIINNAILVPRYSFYGLLNGHLKATLKIN